MNITFYLQTVKANIISATIPLGKSHGSLSQFVMFTKCGMAPLVPAVF